VSIDTDWPVPQRPMGLGTIYASAGRLSARTALRGLGAALLLIVPCYLLMGSAMRAFFLGAARIVTEHGSDLSQLQPQDLGDVAGSFAFAMAMALLLALASSIAQLAVTVECWDRSLLIERTTGDWLRRLFGRPMAMMIAQLVVLMLVLTVAGFAYILLAAALAGAAGSIGGDIAIFLPMAVVIYFAIATVFRLHEIVADDRGPWRSLLSSMALTRGHWWKVIVVLLPLGLVAGGISQLISPSIDTIDIDDIKSVAAGYRSMAAAFTPLHSLLLGLLSAVAQFLLINLLTALYVDLRARRGDFDFDEAEEIESAME
jgi:hypothetical protein